MCDPEPQDLVEIFCLAALLVSHATGPLASRLLQNSRSAKPPFRPSASCDLPLAMGLLSQGSGAPAGSGSAHVPYRNSKLTHLLKESLGGSALCVMLCTISPSVRYLAK